MEDVCYFDKHKKRFEVISRNPVDQVNHLFYCFRVKKTKTHIYFFNFTVNFELN